MDLIRYVVVVLVVIVLQISHVCELAVASLLIGILQETFNVTDGSQQFFQNEQFSLKNTKTCKITAKQKPVNKTMHAYMLRGI